MTARHLVYAPLAALQPAEVNPKMHDLPALIASLTRFGFTAPAILDERTGRLAGGHGRREALIAMKENGDPLPGGVYLDDDGDWLMPVIRGWHSRDDAEAKAYIVADNQLTIAGGWHMKSLAQLLEDVITEDASLMETLAFTADDIDQLLHRVDPESLNRDLDSGGDGWNDSADERQPRAEETADVLDGDRGRARTHTCPGCGLEFEAA